MIFGGAILKNKIGLQGDLNVWEGSGSRQLLLPHTYALQVEKRNENQSDNYTANIPIRMNQKQAIYKSKEFPNLSFKVAAYCPHVRDKLESWIKGNYATISGHPPLQVNNWQPSDPLKYEQLPLDQTSAGWNVGAMRTEYTSNLIRKAYLNGLSLHISSKINPEKSLDLNPEDNLEKPLSFDNGILCISLSLCYSTIKAFENPHLTIRWQSSHSEEEEITTIALQGNQALYNLIQTDSWLGVSRFNIDLKRDQPTFLMIEDQFDDVHLCSFDSHGRVHGLAFCHSGLDSLIVYDEGFGGYAVQTHLPYPPIASSRKDKEKADGKILSLQIHQAANHSIHLSPPLAMFKKACEKAQVNLPDAFIEFLTIWQQSYQLLFPNIDINSPLKEVLEEINWQDAEDPEDRQACQWVRMLFERLEYPMLNGGEMIDFLEANKWPLVNDLKQDRLLNERPGRLYSRNFPGKSFQFLLKCQTPEMIQTLQPLTMQNYCQRTLKPMKLIIEF